MTKYTNRYPTSRSQLGILLRAASQSKQPRLGVVDACVRICCSIIIVMTGLMFIYSPPLFPASEACGKKLPPPPAPLFVFLVCFKLVQYIVFRQYQYLSILSIVLVVYCFQYYYLFCRSVRLSGDMQQSEVFGVRRSNGIREFRGFGV